VFGYLLLAVGTATAAALTYSYGPSRRRPGSAPDHGARRPESGPLTSHAAAHGA